MRNWLAVLVPMVMALGGCGDDDDTDSDSSGEITAAEMVGTWRTDEPSYVRFDEDGSYRIAFTEQGLDSSPVEQGEFTVEGTVFTFISNADSGACMAGDRGKYEQEVLEEGLVRQVLVEDECAIRGSTGDVVIERIP